MSALTTTGASKSVKSFWSLSNFNLDSILGKVLVFGGGGFALWKLLPIINSIVWNALSIIVGGGILAFILLFLWEGTLPKLAIHVVKLISRGLAGMVILMDPLGILENCKGDVEKKMEQFKGSMASLRASKINMARTLDEMSQEYDRLGASVKAAQKDGRGNDPVVRSDAVTANDMVPTINKYRDMVAKTTNILTLLEKYYQMAELSHRRLVSNIKLMKDERRDLKSANSALKSAWSVISGSAADEFYDQALATARQQASQMMGEIDQLLFESQGALSAFENDQSGAIEQLLARLEAKDTEDTPLLQLQTAPAVLLTGPVLTSEKELVPVSGAPDSNKKKKSLDELM